MELFQALDQVNFVKSKKDKKKGNVNKNIYQNKYHNFSEKFSLEDRLLLVRLYNRYTEENCMTFKTFARKFKKKANEWINNNREETMWEHEHLRRQKSLGFIEGIEGLDDFSDLEVGFLNFDIDIVMNKNICTIFGGYL